MREDTPFRIALILGGARSGKSRYALELAGRFPPPRLYVATAEPGDGEMAARIAEHRRSRGEGWETWEIPLHLPEALVRAQGRFEVLVVDCLTLWLSNWLLRGEEEAALQARMEELRQAVSESRIPVILVSNEVGWGIVPENPLARRFRDLAGFLHQTLAAAAERVVLLVAGQPLWLK